MDVSCNNDEDYGETSRAFRNLGLTTSTAPGNSLVYEDHRSLGVLVTVYSTD